MPYGDNSDDGTKQVIGGYENAQNCKRCDEPACDKSSCRVVRYGEGVCVPCARDLDRGMGWNEFEANSERFTVACSGCGELIPCSFDAIPNGANHCPCGAVKHRYCGCSAWTPAGYDGHRASLAEQNATMTLDDLNHTLDLSRRSEDVAELERISTTLAAIASRATKAIGENAVAIARLSMQPLGIAS